MERLKLEYDRKEEEMENDIIKSKSIFKNALEGAQINIDSERKSQSEAIKSYKTTLRI